MPKMSPEEAAGKWQRNAAAAAGEYTRGVERVTVAPGDLAAASVAKFQARFLESVPKWERNVRVPLGEWQQAAREKGSQRFASGVAQAEPKMARALAELFPHIERVQAQVRSMPSTSLPDRINRAVAFMNGMAQYRKPGGGRR
jgi:hypothetical protein